MSRVLVVDDEPSICWAFDTALSESGHSVCAVSTAEDAFSEAERFHPDVILLDYRLPGMDGLSALPRLKSRAAEAPVILMTAFGSLNLAVDALHQGAFDYLPKPFGLDEAMQVVSRALSSREQAPAPKEPPDLLEEMAGVSLGMQKVFRQIALVAQMDVPVLITGESGVGKELVARAIHRHSGRNSGKFVPVCVAALNESLLESELFGHVKGAFTGADRHRAGLLEHAHDGTAFFDEIGEIPLPQQVKLLRVLEDRQIVPVGGTDSTPSAFRLIAATHRPLETLVASGAFRQDLYYRLNVFRIEIPALRHRPEDIPILADRFLKLMSGDRALSFSDEAMTELRGRPWIGNVRELRSAVQHAAVVCRGNVITPECLPDAGASFRSLVDPDQMLQLMHSWIAEQLSDLPDQLNPPLYERFLNRFEPTVLEGALHAAHGNRTVAAEMLGLHRETLRKRLRKHGLEEGEIAS